MQGFKVCFSQKNLLISVSDYQKKVILGGHFTIYFEVENSIKSENNLHDSLSIPHNWSILTHKKTEIDNTKTRFSYTICTSRNNKSGKPYCGAG